MCHTESKHGKEACNRSVANGCKGNRSNTAKPWELVSRLSPTTSYDRAEYQHPTKRAPAEEQQQKCGEGLGAGTDEWMDL